MEVKRWQKKVWWLAKYFELAVPMTFIVCMIWMCNWRIAIPWFVLGAVAMLVYMGMLREIVEATCRRQAQDWLASIRHRLTESDAKQLRMQAEDLELHVCRLQTVVPAVLLTILACMHVLILSMLARVVIAVLVGGLVISHFLMARMWIREEMAKEWHSV